MTSHSPDLLGTDHPRYKKVRDIYEGTIGFTQLCQNKENQELVVIQFIQRGNTFNAQVSDSILIHQKLNHPHVIKFVESFLLNAHVAVVTEFAAGGELCNYVLNKDHLSEDEARKYFLQLVGGVEYCHQMGVKNKELKLENILLDGQSSPLLKLCNSKYEMIRCSPKSKDVLPRHVAPEAINNQKYDGNMADVWSCGVMLYFMLFGSHPFERQQDFERPSQKLKNLMSRISTGDYQIPTNFSVSMDCIDILSKILQIDPQKRITFQQIQQHLWFKLQENINTNQKSNGGVNLVPPKGVQSEAELKQILNCAKKNGGDSSERDLSLCGIGDDSIEELYDDQFEDEENLIRSSSYMKYQSWN
eukprot:TRINITY_DN14381_c0_g1_i2.p1 TRINITY_DN14381_c0_g1~~TRINITY_DN14381_c0_g1_i2.p1  ORF type:complete len:360 (+),score=55.00 TRINITY_DN14381_c0_g1_i2:468-1547(+)